MTSDINIVGKPSINLSFCVLCLNKYMPAIVPIEPPNKAISISVFSGILHLPYFAFFLSIYITKKPNRLITIKYTIIFNGVKYVINPI